ncbi:MAG: pyridoxamine 5'-phosphate oxidase family protein [Myxococcales bacterium]|nr:pyridoxamine 5'-phosphate oxidase family protein [Myxococcales bacterium]
MATDPTVQTVDSPAELRRILGEPSTRAANKARPRLHAMDRRWLAASRFCLVASSDAAGRCDVSPKGDPAGFVHVLDDVTIAVPERSGNRRADTFHNVLDNPHVGLLFMIPGRTDTLRVNGRARVVSDAPYFEAMVVKGHRPQLALQVAIDELFYHCAKAFLRAELWSADTWTPEALPSRAHIVKAIEAPQTSLQELEHYYGPAYADSLYPSGDV